MVIFIHGLNTYGDDDIHIGPLKFGPMHAHLEDAMKARGVTRFHALTRFGMGSAEDQADKALFLLPSLTENERVHLIGQSTGGLVARVLATKSLLKGRVASVTTIGTPHAGAPAADVGLRFKSDHPILANLFRACGYDTSARSEFFTHFTSSACTTLGQRLRHEETGPKEYSLLCAVEKKDLSWPLRPLYGLFHIEAAASDGLIPLESQRWGTPFGPFALDHFGELGFFPHLAPSARRRARLEFLRMVDKLAEIDSS